MSVELTIVMPCLNEAETLEICILKAQAFLDRAGISGEILIGDNGSTDGSQDIARRCGARVVDVGVKGYGAAIYGAVMEARGRYCIMGDSDDSYDFCRLELFVEKLRGGTDLVMGNRFLGGIAPEAMPWQNRYIGNPILSGIGRLLFRCPVRDFHCGLRGFSREAFLQMRLRTVGMEFASEMIIKATILNMKIAEVPTTLAPDGRSRPPHLRPYRDGWRHLRFMLLFSPNWLLLYPGLMLMLAGVALGVTLVVHPIRIGSVRLSIDTLIYCASMIEMGFQSVLFALLSRSYAAQEGLIPRSRQTAWVDRIVSLERGLVLGIVLIVAGLLMLTHALTAWSNTGFGNLDVEQVTRTVVGSSLCLCLGFEVILSSLLLSTFRLSLRGTT